MYVSQQIPAGSASNYGEPFGDALRIRIPPDVLLPLAADDLLLLVAYTELVKSARLLRSLPTRTHGTTERRFTDDNQSSTNHPSRVVS